MQNDGCLNFVDENDEVLISGFGRRGKAKGDIPGVRFKVVKVSGVGLLALWKEKKVGPTCSSRTATYFFFRKSHDRRYLCLCFFGTCCMHMSTLKLTIITRLTHVATSITPTTNCHATRQ